MEIRILGAGCANCNKLEQLVFDVCAENNINADIQRVTDFKEFAKYGVMNVPGLVVNGKVLLAGGLPSKNTLENWLKNALV